MLLNHAHYVPDDDLLKAKEMLDQKTAVRHFEERMKTLLNLMLFRMFRSSIRFYPATKGFDMRRKI